jgi:hypothetical protein
MRVVRTFADDRVLSQSSHGEAVRPVCFTMPDIAVGLDERAGIAEPLRALASEQLPRVPVLLDRLRTMVLGLITELLQPLKLLARRRMCRTSRHECDAISPHKRYARRGLRRWTAESSPARTLSRLTPSRRATSS